MAHSFFSFSLFFSTVFLSFALPFESAARHTLIPIKDTTETDRLALLAIKSKIISDPFQALRSWNDSSLSFCKWKGVTCNPPLERVSILNLSSQGLLGSLSPHLGNLTFLKTLTLDNNSFHGEIPPEVGRLYRLQTLKLSNNSFVGKIPVDISRCSNLQNLFLGYNHLVGKIPVEIGSLSKLVHLSFRQNSLTGTIPSSIGNLSSLEYFSLTENNLEGSLPSALGKLQSLSYLSLGVNMFSGVVPPLLYNISSLSYIVFAKNQLNGSLPPQLTLPNLDHFLIGGNQFSGTIPASLFNDSRLLYMDISSNDFFGEVPLEVGNLKGLQYLNLGVNRLVNGKTDDLYFLTALTNCTHLTMLDISSNYFEGVLPNSIANLSTQLSYLYLGVNQMHGSIPIGFEKYADLSLLAMEGNFFTGTIPPGIGMLQKLQVFALQGNQLTGQLPLSLGNMSSLYDLDLSHNMLQGEPITQLTKCQFLSLVDLSNNNFTGPLLEQLIYLSSQLLYLDMSRNSFIGHLPVQLGDFVSLQILDVSGNKMHGEIPKTIGGCLNLERLSLNRNFFQGPIPSSFQSLKLMQRLDLSMNNFSGEIPKVLGYLPALKYLNLSFNNLNGTVPTEGVFQNASAFSILGNQKVCRGTSKLQLTECHFEKRKKERKMSLALMVILGVAISSIVISLLVVITIVWRRSKAKTSLESTMVVHFERVSYRQLYQATNGFSLTNLIGVGSFGSVYKGILHEDAPPVAVKVLNLIERGASKSFVTECNALRKIRHRNLLKIISVCSSVDFYGHDFKALILKFMSNGSLENLLHPISDEQYPSNPLTLFQRLNIAIDIASALDYLHNHCETPMVHCDLKPSNILLDDDMTGHVSDFGLAKFLPRGTSNFNTSESSSTSHIGTIGYIPPEYATGAMVSTQGDVYSYGIILLEMITGKRPTDEVFKDDQNLHYYSSSRALSSLVMDIVDPLMRLENVHDGVKECIASIVKVGVSCSLESHSERTGINDALVELHVIRKTFLGFIV